MKLSPLLLLASLVLSAPVDPIPDLVHGSAAFQGAMALESEPELAFPPASGVKNETSLTKMHNKYKTYMKSVLTSRGPHAACNANNVHIRREWSTISPTDRIAYTTAVRCLYHLPSQSNPTAVPGARNRLDDFVATHFQQTDHIHFNGKLYGWHRQFLWLYEQALRQECGYDGPTPYWDWTLHSADLRKSPVFDGSATSMGGNGEYVEHGNTYARAFGLDLVLPPGTGGGCVAQGPFSDLVVNLGLTPNITSPSSFNTTTHPLPSLPTSSPPPNALNYNPRCLTRDLNPTWSALTSAHHLHHLLSCPTLECLSKRADGWERGGNTTYDQQNTIHPAGHFAVGGLANDAYSSPGDPIFYLHHGMLDLVWAVWQGQEAGKRVLEVGGTETVFDKPPSRNVTLEDALVFGVLGKDVRLRDVASTIDGDYCYVYA